MDSSPEMLEIYKSVLEADGYHVVTVRSGADALQLLKFYPIDAVVLDDVMPGMTGVALAEKIKLSKRDVLVVMYSSNLSECTDLPYVDSLLYKGKGPIALRKLLGTLLHK
ncbi:MAG TPA: response regulator [Candidatus Angelobacter sp.]|nr:response regulator [Candidatus Angelobacter sp.]